MATVKTPLHLICEMVAQNKVGALALWIKIKPTYNSSHIKDFRKLNLQSIGICRETYFKYLRQLEAERLVRPDGVFRKGKKRTKRGSKGLILTGQNKILTLFHTYPKYNLQYLHIDATLSFKELCDYLERVAIERNQSAQCHKIERVITDNEICQQEADSKKKKLHVKMWGGERAVEVVNPDLQVGLSYFGTAKGVGKKSSATGRRRQKKWKDRGILVTINRIVEHGFLPQAVVRERRRLGETLFTSKKGITYQQKPNQLLFTKRLIPC